MKPIGITRSQWWVLINLSREECHGVMQTELADMLEIGKVALGGLLDRLEANDYIARLADARDRRAKRLEITENGKLLLDRMNEGSTNLNMEMQQDVTPEEVRATADILYRMKKRLLEMDAALKTGEWR